MTDFQPQFPVDVAIIVEEEQANITLPGVSVDRNLVAHRFARLGKAAIEGGLTPEQAIDTLIAIQKIGTHPRNQQQVGLTRFDHQTRRHGSMVQIPRIPSDVRFCPDCSRSRFTGLRIDPSDSICQQQWRHRHPDLPFVAILLFKQWTEHFRDFSASEDLQLLSCKAGAARRLSADCRLGRFRRTTADRLCCGNWRRRRSRRYRWHRRSADCGRRGKWYNLCLRRSQRGDSCNTCCRW